MSGGFFQGASADQDSRISNKKWKIPKSQEFASVLDYLVDTTKVKMDVIRPWIATRATQLLGFEDEVLVNFIYNLLDGKVVDGKTIQIQITGLMNGKIARKFMKELWILLLSAQSTASGVPQQFVDPKEEEMMKKKDDEAGHLNPKGFNYSDEEREADGRHGRIPHNRTLKVAAGRKDAGLDHNPVISAVVSSGAPVASAFLSNEGLKAAHTGNLEASKSFLIKRNPTLFKLPKAELEPPEPPPLNEDKAGSHEQAMRLFRKHHPRLLIDLMALATQVCLNNPVRECKLQAILKYIDRLM